MNEPSGIRSRTGTHYDWKKRLNEAYRPPPAPGAETFWNEFRARAAELPRVRAVSHPAWALEPRRAAWAAAALLLLGLIWWRTAVPLSARRRPARIEVVSISQTASSYMIWHDEQGQGTFVWLVAEAPVPGPGG